MRTDGFTDGTILRRNRIEDSGGGRQKTCIRLGKNARSVELDGNQIQAATPVADERTAVGTR